MTEFFKPFKALNSTLNSWVDGTGFGPIKLFTLPEIDNKYVVSYDIPGVSDQDVNITVNQSLISIVAKSQSKNTHRNYQYSFIAPIDADLDKIEALVENGVLTLSIEKKKPLVKQEGKKIEVKSIKTK